MAEKKTETKTHKPARTIEQQIADLHAKQEAINEKRAASLAARHTVFTEQLTKAEARVATIKENIDALKAEANELGIELDEATEAEDVEVENVEVQRAEVV